MMGSTGVHMHKIECPVCSHGFYTSLPDPNEYSGDPTELRCVECEAEMRKVYQFTEREDHVDMKCEIEIIGGDEDE